MTSRRKRAKPALDFVVKDSSVCKDLGKKACVIVIKKNNKEKKKDKKKEI